MASKKSLLQQMNSNPRADWSISDIEKLCREVGLSISPPKSGSHFKVYSDIMNGMQTIPAHRPIKPVYIRSLVSFCEAHNKRKKGE